MDSRIIYMCPNYKDYEFKSKRIWRTDGKYEPFVYIIQEVETEMMYIGSKTQYKGRPCLESWLGTRYFTSSDRFDWESNPESFEICKIIPCVSNHDAIILERLLIEQNGAVWDEMYYNISNAGLGCNMTGYNHSTDTKKKISEGNKRYWEGNPGGHFTGKTHTEETRKKISENKKGDKHPQYRKYGKEHTSFGTKRTPEQRKNISDAVKKTMTPERRKQISNKTKSLPKKECPYCNKLAAPGMFSRWHGDRCKYKK